MGLNLSNQQIARELSLNDDDVCIFRLNPPSDFGGKRPPVSVQTALPFR
jgi:hypothetical protein